MTNNLTVKTNPELESQKHYIPRRKISTLDMIKGTATFYYGRNVDFEDMDRKDEMLKRNGYEINSTDIKFSRGDGVIYIINFEPRDLVA